jgi:starch-binding outer membrane protein, SusD/RagB family
MLKEKYKLLVVAAALFGATLTSCKKSFLETNPTNAVSDDAALESTKNAYAALNGIHRILYVQYDNQPEGGEGAAMIIRDLLGEDVIYTNPAGRMDFAGFIQWISHRNVNSGNMRFVYRMYYRIISNANVLINGIDKAVGPDADKKIIKGQALAYRAWSHFQLVQLWGERYKAGGGNTQLGVPLITVNTTEGQPRATVEEVYTQINKDLDEAITLLQGYVPAGSAAKSNITANVAKGFKARVALTQGEWETAATNAIAARAGFSLMTNAEYLQGFNKLQNQEWMWGSRMIADHTTFFWTFHASMGANFNGSNTRTQPRAINANLWNALPATDIRKQVFDLTGANVPVPPGGIRIPYHSKKFLSEGVDNSIGDVPYMRMAEMYLIEAEARARQNRDADARAALFTLVKNRNPNYTLSTNSGQALLDEILLHRRVELWGEGFRFTDLKRMNTPMVRTGIPNHNPTISVVMNIPAGDKQWQWLFHQDELNTNKALVQNPL